METLNFHDAYTFLNVSIICYKGRFHSSKRRWSFFSPSLFAGVYLKLNLHSFQVASLLKENESLREQVSLMELFVFLETSLVIIPLFIDKSCLLNFEEQTTAPVTNWCFQGSDTMPQLPKC